MRMKFARTTALVIYALTALLTTGCVTTQLHKFRMTVSEAPEVHGANTNQKQNSSVWRFTGKVNYNYEEKVNISEDIHRAMDLDELFDENILKFDDAAYKMGGLDFTAKVDYLRKTNYFVYGLGAGYKDGLFSHLLFGWNFSHFEFGAFAGLYTQFYEVEYKGTVVDDDDVAQNIRDNNYHTGTSFFAGAYAGLYFEKLFFNYSISTYIPPSVTIENRLELSVPRITSHYFTVGYRITDWIEISAGGIINYIHVTQGNATGGYTGGVSFYL